jgi:hypothetical protein
MLVPVTYKAVLDSIPGLHARPPRLPETRQRDEEDLPVIPPPEKGYDFIFHVGVSLVLYRAYFWVLKCLSGCGTWRSQDRKART